MRQRHNKKRNTAFLYEILVREAAKTVINKDFKRKIQIVSLIKEHFGKETEMAKEIELYNTLRQSDNIEEYVAEKLIQEAKKEYERLNHDRIFFEQSALISKINKMLSKNVFSNFIPNYKNIATIAQIFNSDVSTKKRILLENKLFKRMVDKEKTQEDKVQPISNLTFNIFVKKFNESYKENLLKEQKELLNNYIMSFSDNGLGLKIFLTQEIDRLRENVKKSLEMNEIKVDSTMLEKTNKVLDLIESFKTKPIDQEVLGQVLKIQNLANEIEN